MKKLFTARRLMTFIFVTFLISILFTVIRIILAPSEVPATNLNVRVKSDYILMLLQCVVGAAAMLLPGYLRRRVNLAIPDAMMIVYAIFLYCAIYLGEVQNFYYNIPGWDTVLHTFSGAALGALGFSIISLLNDSESVAFSLSPVFAALFALCFAVSLGVVWEIYEFAMDFFLHTNMQKYAYESGEQLIGQAALADSMKDLIVDLIGAFTVSMTGFLSMKIKKSWLKDIQLRVKRSK